jgi:hypothetical protein
LRVYLTSADHGLGYELFPVSKKVASRFRRESGNESVLISSDWDYPSLARNLGWRMRDRKCAHNSTDGTVRCESCGKSASAFIQAAQKWLDLRVDSVFQGDFEGYFGL